MGRAENTFSTNDTHCTPPEVYEPILKALRIDAFGFDPFGNPGSVVPAKEVVWLPAYWSGSGDAATTTLITARGEEKQRILRGDAYDFDWSGRGAVWCNGPTSDCAPWAKKMHGDEGGDENVSLWPVRTGAKWWQRWVAPSDAILFWEGRVKFVGQEHQAPWHSAISYVGPRADLFVEGMKSYGWIVRNRREW